MGRLEAADVHARRSTRRPEPFVRYLAWLCLFLMLWPGFAVGAASAPPTALPVVTNLSGAVVVRSTSGVSRDVLSTQIVRPGDTLVTGVDSLALLSLADVGNVRLGPGSTATASSTASTLTVNLNIGSVCAQAQAPGVTVQSGGLSLSAGDATSIFSLIRDADSTTIAVYQGQISATLAGKPPTVLHAGDAAVSSHGGVPSQVPIEGVQPQFAALHCPDDAIIAAAVPTPVPSPAGGHGGGGGFLGILAGLGLIAALAGGHGGGGGGGSTPPPTAPPGPGNLSLSLSSLPLLLGGSSQSFTASESSYSGVLSATSGDKSVATVTPASGVGPGPVTFTVTPVGAGSTTITVTDDHGGSSVVNVIVNTLMVSPGTLSFVDGQPAQTFSATETGYTGSISAVSGNNAVASVSPASGSGPSVTFTVTPKGPGSTSITVSDTLGNSQKVSISVTTPGSITVLPGSLTFVVGAGSQTFKASESGYAGPITATTGDSTVATVSGSGTGPGPVTFTVIPVGAGTTTITVNGSGPPATVNITVAGPLSAAPTSLTFSGSTASQPFTASDPFFSGTLSASTDNPGVATVSPSSQGGPGPVTFNVSPVSEGTAHITVSDTLGQSTQVSIVVSAGGLVVNPPTLVFTVTGAPQTFTASEADYSGLITAASSIPGQASVSPASGSGPGPITFTVTPVSAGNPTIAVADTHAHTKFVDVTVTGPLTPTPSGLTFNGNATPQTISVTDPNFPGAINASSTDNSVATVTSPGVGSPASFTVTPVNQPGASGSATINFSDANLGTASASITVNAGALSVSTPSISLTGAGSTGTFNASEVLYSGPINAATTNTAVATVAPASGAGPGPLTFTVTAVGPGTANINTTDNHGGSQTVTITVTEVPTVAPGSLTFTDVGSTNAQSATISEPGYSGTFSKVADSCGGIAKVGPVSGTGPSATVPVFALASTASGGTCEFSIKDDVNGGVSSPVNVTVGPFGPVAPSPSTLSFGDVGAGAAKTFAVSEANYTGPFTLDLTSCSSSVATASPLSGTSSTTFTVTPVGSGTCTIAVDDDHTQTASVTATVATFGPIVLSPTSLTFTDVGAGSANTFTASESGYAGLLTADASACSGIATVSPPSNPSGGTFTVTPVGGGTCSINVDDDHTQTSPLSVTVGPFGSLSLSKSTSNINTLGGTDTFTATETVYTGAISAATSNASVVTVAPATGTGPGPITFTITSVALGNANINVTDDHGGSSTLLASVTAGGLTVNPVTLSFAVGGAAQTFTANDLPFASVFTATSTGTSIATVTPALQPGPGPVTFTVTPSATNSGTVSITVADDIGGAAVVSVGVGVSPLIRKRKPVVIHKGLHPVATPVPHGPRPIGTPGNPKPIVVNGGRPTPAPQPVAQPPPATALAPLSISRAAFTLQSGSAQQPLVISEPGYSRRFTISTSNAAVVRAGASSASGPTASIMLAPVGPGVATVRIADDHGGVQTITVIVRAPQPPASQRPQRPGIN